jgi:LuxR family maltose regulon positive regulatory protein
VLSQWAAGVDVPLAWASLDEADNDPAHLLESLGEALRAIRPIDPEVAQTLARPVLRPSEGVGTLLRAMGSDPYVLVIDNVEAITSTAASQMLAEVVTKLPVTARLALASRAEPPLPTARLRASGQVLEIRAHDLAMGRADAAALLEGAGVTATSDEQLDELVEHSEGWPAGLYLAALALRGDGVPGGPAVSFGGDDRAVTDYLRSEVLARLAPEVVTFLLRTSVLDRMSGALCDHVLGRSGSAALLESLERSNLLIIPLDRRREWYRYHRLLREMLANELRRTEPAGIAGLHARAAAWFESEGQLEAALSHAQAGEDIERAARLLVLHGPIAYSTGRMDTIRRWLAWFDTGDRVSRHPEVAALAAIFEALLAEPAAAERWAKTATRDVGRSARADDRDVARLLRVMDAVLCQSGVEQMRIDAEAAAATLGSGVPLRAAAHLFSGVAAVLAGTPNEADRQLVLAIDVGRGFSASSTVDAALALRAVIAIDRQDWCSAAAHSADALAGLPSSGAEGNVAGLIVHAVAARVAAHSGAVHAGQTHLTRATRLRSLCTYVVPWTAHHLVQLCHAHLELGDPAGARLVVRQIEEILLIRPDLGVVHGMVEAVKARLHTMWSTSPGASSLTTAELRLLPYLATHLSFPEIGEQLFLSRHTIKTQAMSVYRKVGASSRSEAVERLHELGLLGP